MREIAAGRPGLVTKVGLGTYVDPRQTGGKQNARTTEDLVELVTLRGEEWLLFHAFPIDVVVIRGTTADEDGNLTMEGEALQGEMLSMAMAARNSGGMVIAQVRQLARRGNLPLRDVKVPGALVDYVFVDPDQWQTYVTQDSPYYAAPLRRPVDARAAAAPRRAQDHRPPLAARVPARRDLQPGLRDQPADRPRGVGGGDHRPPRADGGAGDLRRRPGRRQRGRDRLQLPGDDRPADMFDFYEGGGLDIASLSFAEVDAQGNVNVHAFEGRVRGPGGFPNISARTPRINFVGTLTAQGLELAIDGAGVRVVSEGSLPKFVPRSARSRSTGRSPASAASRSGTSRTGRCSRSRTTGSC